MKVVIGGGILRSPLTGIGNYTQDLLTGMLKSELVEVVYLVLNGHVIEFERGWRSSVAGSGEKFAFVSKLKGYLRFLPGSYQLRSIIDERALQKLYRRDSGVIYHEPNNVLRQYKGKTVVTIHDLSHIQMPETHPSSRVKYLKQNLGETINRADHVISVSDFTKQEILRNFDVDDRKITTVYNCVSSDYKPRPVEDLKCTLDDFCLVPNGYFLSVATIEPRKNHEVILEAYYKAFQDFENIMPLVLVGNVGWKAKQIVKKIKSYSKKCDVRWLGYVDHRVLSILYSGAKVFLHPSKYEGFGLPLMEAMASGVPVIAAKHPVVEEVGEGLVEELDGNDIFAWKRGLIEYAEKNVGEAAVQSYVERAKQFGVDAFCNECVEVYKRLRES